MVGRPGLVCLLPALVLGHGRLMEPPARNSMWRFGYINPINYNDNEVFCGGMSHQFEKNGGRCGVCGDAYDAPIPRTHETGGNYGNKVITRSYVKNSVIEVEVEVTANHKGRFSLKICPVAAGRREATQACLDHYPLTQLDGEDEFPIHERGHKVVIRRQARLPRGLSCARCVLQWTWTSANSWGRCANGTAGLGCGPQETFRNCADVRVVTSPHYLPATDNPRAIMIRDANSKNLQRPLVIRAQVCIATPAYKVFGRAMDVWCQQNCLYYPPNCPAARCTCPDSCSAQPGSKLDDFECNKRCLRYPHTENCPPECSCHSEQGQDFASLDTVQAGEDVSPLDAVIVDARGAPAGPVDSSSLVQTFLAWVPRVEGLFRLQDP